MDGVEDITGEERTRLYGFLARVFRSAPTGQSSRAVSEMATALGIPCPEGWTLSELEHEFKDLFVVPNARYVAPYESAYRDHWLLPTTPGAASEHGAAPRFVQRLLMGESTLAMRQCFLAAGVLPVDDLPDHLGNELRLLSHLWSRDAQASGDENNSASELRAKVRTDHLLKWIGLLRNKVVEHERLGFYSVVLHLTEAVLQNDEDCEGRTAL